MLVITCFTPGVNPSEITDLFRAAGFYLSGTGMLDLMANSTQSSQIEANNFFEIKQIQELAMAHDKTRIKDSKFIFFYSNPMILISNSLESDVNDMIGAKLQDWYTDVRYIIDFFKKNRSHCSVIDISDCFDNPLQFIQLIRPDYAEYTSELMFRQKTSPINLWAAQQILDKIIEIKNLYTELQACSVDIKSN